MTEQRDGLLGKLSVNAVQESDEARLRLRPEITIRDARTAAKQIPLSPVRIGFDFFHRQARRVAETHLADLDFQAEPCGQRLSFFQWGINMPFIASFLSASICGGGFENGYGAKPLVVARWFGFKVFTHFTDPAATMDKTILITGGADFIGPHLADELLEHSSHVRVLDNLSAQVHRQSRLNAFFNSSLVAAYWNGAATCYRGLSLGLFERGLRDPQSSGAGS